MSMQVGNSNQVMSAKWFYLLLYLKPLRTIFHYHQSISDQYNPQLQIKPFIVVHFDLIIPPMH